jgi:hypothetical protein
MSVYVSLNITYHQQNTIYNFVGAVKVAVAFAVILFRLSRIYRRSNFVSNSISNSDIYDNSFPTLYDILTELCCQQPHQ